MRTTGRRHVRRPALGPRFRSLLHRFFLFRIIIRVDVVRLVHPAAFRSSALVRMGADVPSLLRENRPGTTLELESGERSAVSEIHASVIYRAVARIRVIALLAAFEIFVGLSSVMTCRSVIVVTWKKKNHRLSVQKFLDKKLLLSEDTRTGKKLSATRPEIFM